MGGFVTWAKRCFKKWWTSRDRLATAARGSLSVRSNSSGASFVVLLPAG